ncbi:MAG: VOC family protein [Anaerolineae bacterium]|nr:VOC family protein [Anaerolineae bacterium]
MSAIHWFEIGVSDIQRAIQFYETVMNTKLQYADLREQMGSQLGMFPARDGAGGTLVQNEQHGYQPGQAGTLIYLVVDGDLNEAVARVDGAGGQVVLPKTPLGSDQEAGFISWIIDTEGNKVGLYSKV